MFLICTEQASWLLSAWLDQRHEGQEDWSQMSRPCPLAQQKIFLATEASGDRTDLGLNPSFVTRRFCTLGPIFLPLQIFIFFIGKMGMMLTLREDHCDD